jgi:hypothetical protein
LASFFAGSGQSDTWVFGEGISPEVGLFGVDQGIEEMALG